MVQVKSLCCGTTFCFFVMEALLFGRTDSTKEDGDTNFQQFLCNNLPQAWTGLIVDSVAKKELMVETMALLESCKLPVSAMEIGGDAEHSERKKNISACKTLPQDTFPEGKLIHIILRQHKSRRSLNVIILGKWRQFQTLFKLMSKISSLCSPHIRWLALFTGNIGKTAPLPKYVTQQCNVVFGSGYPDDLNLYSLKHASFGQNIVVPIDIWTSLSSEGSSIWPSASLSNDLMGRHLRIAMNQHFPFYIPPTANKSGVRIESRGLDINILETMKSVMNFTYEVVSPPDGRWGSKRNGSWTGLIGMVLRQRADMAMGGVTISGIRMEAVDFSFPYLYDYTTFVVRSPEELPRTWVITRPFGWKVWTCVISALIMVSLILYAVEMTSRVILMSLARNHFVEPYARKPKQLSLAESIWFTFRAFLNQGAFPATFLASRLVVSTWLLSILILLAAYGGNLVSKLTAPTYEDPIDTIGELVSAIRDNRINCGTIRDSSDHAIFKDSDYPPFQTIEQNMDSNNDNFVHHDIEGLRKVLTERYAYIAGRVTVEADITRPSLFLFAKDLFLMSGYGIAFSKGFWYQEAFANVLLRFMQTGIINKWLEDTFDSIRQQEQEFTTPTSSQRPISLEEFQGVFVLLLFGYAAAFTVLCLRIAWKSCRLIKLSSRARRL